MGQDGAVKCRAFGLGSGAPPSQQDKLRRFPDVPWRLDGVERLAGLGIS